MKSMFKNFTKYIILSIIIITLLALGTINCIPSVLSNMAPTILQNAIVTSSLILAISLLAIFVNSITFSNIQKKSLLKITSIAWAILSILSIAPILLVANSYHPWFSYQSSYQPWNNQQMPFGLFMIIFIVFAIISLGLFITINCFELKLAHLKLQNKLSKAITAISKVIFLCIPELIFAESNIWYVYFILFMILLSKTDFIINIYKKQLD